jgi:hypothetical protein
MEKITTRHVHKRAARVVDLESPEPLSAYMVCLTAPLSFCKLIFVLLCAVISILGLRSGPRWCAITRLLKRRAWLQ